LPATARNIDHVNVGRIAVSDQSLSSQQKAGKQALAQVFIKLSGNPQVLNSAAIDRAVDNYEQFLTASSFIQIKEQLVFEAQFNRQKVENLLMATGLGVWASLRPSAILWLASKAPNNDTQVLFQNQALMQQTTASLATTVALQAYARGVEIVLPIGDFEDTTNVSVYDVWNQFVSVLQRHSQRYATDYVMSATLQAYSFDDHQSVLAQHKQRQEEYDALSQQDTKPFDSRLSPENMPSNQSFVTDIINELESDQDELNANALENSSNISANITATIPVSDIQQEIPEDTSHKLDYVITNNKTVVTGTIYANSQKVATQKLVDAYANMLAKQFALGSSNGNSDNEAIILKVSNIDSLADYVALLQLIESVPAITKVQLAKQDNKQSFFKIEQNISIEQLRSILSLDPRLRIENTIPNLADMTQSSQSGVKGSQSLQFSWME